MIVPRKAADNLGSGKGLENMKKGSKQRERKLRPFSGQLFNIIVSLQEKDGGKKPFAPPKKWLTASTSNGSSDRLATRHAVVNLTSYEDFEDVQLQVFSAGVTSHRARFQMQQVETNTETFCVEFACSPRLCLSSLPVLQLPPTVQEHAFEVNRRL